MTRPTVTRWSLNIGLDQSGRYTTISRRWAVDSRSHAVCLRATTSNSRFAHQPLIGRKFLKLDHSRRLASLERPD
jgi:hypothetical protein